MLSLNPERLLIFLVVAKNLSYTKAAEELYLSQPAVSKQIQELEKELDTRLFDRKGNRIQLTHTGEVAYSYAITLERLLQDLQYDIDQTHKSLSGSLRIGASSTISQYIIPPIIARFKQAFPDLSLSLISGNTSEINQKLQQDQIHIGITEGVQKLNNFSYTPFISDEIVLVSHKTISSFPEYLSGKEIKKTPLIIREIGSGTRDVFKKAIHKLGLNLKDLPIVMTLGSTESIKSYLEYTEAVGVFSIHAIRNDEYDKYHLSRIANLTITRQFQFIQKQGAHLKSAGHFIRFARDHYNLKL